MISGCAAIMFCRRGGGGTSSRRAFHRILETKICSSTTTKKLSSPLSTHQNRCFVSASGTLHEKIIMKVPTMGDSITEGTIVEWQAKIGQKVEEEEIIALIETDKVTVDIRATTSGVLTQQFGEIDDNVDVGADLCEIDTDAEATVEASSSSSTTTEVPKEDSPPVASTTAVSTPEPAAAATLSSSPRVPSIKFLGKEGWAAALTVQPDVIIPANYGRPPFTDVEMEALVTGGANLAPELMEYSTKAVWN